MLETMADNQITITESGAFIPRSLFSHETEIVATLRKAAEQAPTVERQQPKQPLRVEMPDSAREMQWIKEHRKEYAGQWVALDGDRLLSHGMNAKEVFAAADESGIEDPFFAHLEPADALPFGGW
jgi:hypothetical protein